MEENVNVQGKFDVFMRILKTQYWFFEGRMSKKEYWDFMIPALIIGCLLSWTILVPLALLAPMLGTTARRLHDLGKSGWLNVLWFICPPIGPIIVLVMCAKDGMTEANDFGEVPEK